MPGFKRTKETKFIDYSNLEGILLVREGYFSFFSMLVKVFRCAFKLVATSLDNRGDPNYILLLVSIVYLCFDKF